MNSIPQVSIITTVYNGMPYIAETIESILGQTFTDFEYIIIDDGSTDGSQQCIQSYGDSRIQFIQNQQNVGTSESMNKGIALARAPLIARMDHDDVSLPERVEAQWKQFEQHPELAVSCTWEYGIDGGGRKVRRWQSSIENRGGFLAPLFVGKCPIWHPSLMARTEALRAVGGFSTNYQPVEDFELTARLALAGYHAAIVPQYLVLQRHHGRRQSVTKLGRQIGMRNSVHDELLQRFFKSSTSAREQLGRFLRLDPEFWALCRSKQDWFEVIDHAEECLDAVQQAYNLTSVEVETLNNVIEHRIGNALRYCNFLRTVPSVFFFPVLFTLSPLLLPRVRALASRAFELIQELRYPIRLARAGMERRAA